MTGAEYALLANTLIGISLLLGFFCLSRTVDPSRFLIASTAVAIGAMLAVVFLEIMPTAIAALESHEFTTLMAIGIGVSYMLELVLHFHHCHDIHEDHTHHSEEHTKAGMMFFGTFLHNFFHGIFLLAAFSVSTELGWGLAVAILLHAIPQNMANFLMNKRNWIVSVLTAFSGVFGALAFLPLLDQLQALQAQLIAFACGVLVYLAMSDLLPLVNEKSLRFQRVKYSLLIGVGILLPSVIDSLFHI